MVSHVNALWPTLFAVGVILLVLRKALGIRTTPDLSATSRLFLLLAASLFVAAGVADLIARVATIGTW
jgi:type III secretory pathway component EscR